jgi:hypothetical protein
MNNLDDQTSDIVDNSATNTKKETTQSVDLLVQDDHDNDTVKSEGYL